METGQDEHETAAQHNPIFLKLKPIMIQVQHYMSNVEGLVYWLIPKLAGPIGYFMNSLSWK